MRAAVVKKFGGPKNILIENDVTVPEIHPNQVLIRVKAASVNPVDTYIRAGHFMHLPKLPYSPGMDGAGLIEKVGNQVKKFKHGDRVWFLSQDSGACAEFCAVDEDMVYELPRGVTFQQGATLGICYMTAYKALFIDAKAKQGDTILVHGASGGVGIAAVQIASANGLKVVGTASTEEGMKIVKENGADHVFNHKENGYIDKIHISFPDGFDVILEMLANVNMSSDLDLIKPSEKICVIGSQGSIHLNEEKKKKMHDHVINILVLKSTKKEFHLMGEELNKLLAQQEINPIVDQERPLDDLPELHEKIMDYTKGKHGKFVINMDL